jgi:serine/threonine protein kinase
VQHILQETNGYSDPDISKTIQISEPFFNSKLSPHITPVIHVQSGGVGYLIGAIIMVGVGAGISLIIGKGKPIDNTQETPADEPTSDIPVQSDTGPAVSPFDYTRIHPAEKAYVIAVNVKGVAKKKIFKITMIDNYFKPYEDEIKMYKLLREKSARSKIADYREFKQVYSKYIADKKKFITIINIDSVDYVFEDIYQLVHTETLSKDQNFKDKKPIKMVYIWGYYYENIISLFHLMKMYDGNPLAEVIVRLAKAVDLTLNNIHQAYTDIGFIHGDFKADNVLIETSDDFKNVEHSLIFDLDFATNFPNKIDKMPITPQHRINLYLQFKQDKKSSLYKDFIHFWDIYFFNVNLQVYCYKIYQTHTVFQEITNNINAYIFTKRDTPIILHKYFVMITWVYLKKGLLEVVPKSYDYKVHMNIFFNFAAEYVKYTDAQKTQFPPYFAKTLSDITNIMTTQCQYLDLGVGKC